MKYAVMVFLVTFILICSFGAADTMYVDFENGDDTDDGLSPANAWKHCPGDANATGRPASKSLQPGDTVVFRGGVTYRGSIIINASGTEGNPITYKGDGWPGLEGVKAILDGSEPLTGWLPVGSPGEVGNHPSWDKLWYAYAPTGPTALTSNLYQDDQLVIPAMHPNPTDTFYLDDTSNYWAVQPSQATRTTITDSRIETELGGEAVVENGYVFVLRSGNEVDFRKITDYSAAEYKITFDALGRGPYTDRDTLYSIANTLTALDQPGEYVFRETAEPSGHKVYLWPLGDQDPDIANISISMRSVGIHFYGGYFTIEGFKIQKYASETGAAAAIKKDTSTLKSGIAIRNNEVTKIRTNEKSVSIFLKGMDGALIENNYIHENIRQIGMTIKGSYNVEVKNNIVYRQDGTGIYFHSVQGGKMLDNNVSDCRGSHSNGLAVYGDKPAHSYNILVAGNTVIDSKRSLTISESGYITIYNNIFNPKGSSGAVIGIWGDSSFPMKGPVWILNNVIIGSYGHVALTYMTQDGGDYTIKNNIIDDEPENTGGRQFSYNIYVSPYTLPSDLGEGDIIETDLREIFVDLDNDDYHLKPGSPAIDNGTDVTSDLANAMGTFPEFDFDVDKDGNSRPQGAGWDIGAYEYPGVMPTPTPTGSPTPSLTPTPTPTPTPADTTPPSIVSVTAQETFVNIVFDEPLDTLSAENITNYSINNDISITQASLGLDLKTVALTTSSHTDGVTYTLTVENVKDTSENPIQLTQIDYVYRADVTGGLVAHWKFDEAAGTTAQDFSGNGHDGTLINGPVWTGGRINYALDFDGSNDKVTIPHHDDLDPESITLAAWVYLQQSKTWSAILSKDEQVSYWLGLGATTPLFLLSPDGSSESHIRFWADSGITLYNWHHIAATYDGSYVQLYIDGSSSGSPQAYNGGIYQGTSQVLIGDSIKWQTFSNTFNGIIDDVRIYNRALSQEEIQAIYDAAPTPTPSPTPTPTPTPTPPTPLPQYTFDASLEGWSFLPLSGAGFSGALSGYSGGRISISSANDTTNRVGLWIGPLDIPCVADNVYRARFLVSSSQATASSNPQFRMRWIQDQSLESASQVVNPSGSYSNSLPTDPTQQEYTIYFAPILAYNLGVAFDMVDFDAGQYGTHYVDQVTVERFPRPASGTAVKTYTSSADFANWQFLTNVGFGPVTSGGAGTGTLSITSGMANSSNSGFWQSSGTANELTYVADKLYRATYTLRCATNAARNDMPQIRLRCQNEDAQLTQTMELNSQGAGGPGAMPEVGGTNYKVYWETPILPSSPTATEDGFVVTIDLLDFDTAKGGTIYIDEVAIDYLAIP